jgi:retron-type reverse transcriptase
MESSIKDEVCSFHKLYKATQVCRKNVRWKDSVAHFSNHSLKSVYNLKKLLESEKYQISPYSVFEIREPKLRKITSTRFKDRVFQRSLCDNYLTREISKNFIPNNYACQKDKGTDRARECLTRHLKTYCRRKGVDGYVLKLDIHDYFGSTVHEIAIREVNKRVKDKWVCDEVERIIRSFGDGIGIGLGSQVSQLIQLAVLDGLDHYITETLGINLYVRYMDDMILIHEDKDYLRKCLKKIRRRLVKLKLDISPKKTQIFKITQPIKFLGFTFKLHQSGKVTWRLLPSNFKDEKRKLRKLAYRVIQGKMTLAEYEECYKSWRAHATKSDSRYRIRQMDKYKEDLIHGKKCSS